MDRIFSPPLLPSVPSFFFLAALWVLCLNHGDYASHLEETSQIVNFFFLFLTRPLARASCSKRNYATSALSQASLQREAHQGSLMAAQAGSFSAASVLLSSRDEPEVRASSPPLRCICHSLSPHWRFELRELFSYL